MHLVFYQSFRRSHLNYFNSYYIRLTFGCITAFILFRFTNNKTQISTLLNIDCLIEICHIYLDFFYDFFLFSSSYSNTTAIKILFFQKKKRIRNRMQKKYLKKWQAILFVFFFILIFTFFCSVNLINLSNIGLPGFSFSFVLCVSLVIQAFQLEYIYFSKK